MTKLIKENGMFYLIKPDGIKVHISRDNAYNWLMAKLPTAITPGMCIAIDYNNSDSVIAAV